MIETETEVYKLHKEGKIEYLTVKELDKYKEIKHLFTTRNGGVSEGCCTSWNFGARTLDTEANIYENFHILAQVLGTETNRMVLSSQTHTTNIRVVRENDCGKGITRPRDYENIDGLVTKEKNIPIITTHGDCNCIFFFDPVKKAIGVAHSGWKGTLNKISIEMVKIMEKEYGTKAEDLICALGPALCKNCFQVDEDVAQLFFRKEMAKGKYYIDLKKIIAIDLENCGMNKENILDMKLCTKCSNDIFFSHRGQAGRRGLMAAVMMLV